MQFDERPNSLIRTLPDQKDLTFFSFTFAFWFFGNQNKTSLNSFTWPSDPFTFRWYSEKSARSRGHTTSFHEYDSNARKPHFQELAATARFFFLCKNITTFAFSYRRKPRVAVSDFYGRASSDIISSLGLPSAPELLTHLEQNGLQCQPHGAGAEPPASVRRTSKCLEHSRQSIHWLIF